MPLRNWMLRISDILEAVAAIQEYTAGLTFDTFSHDRKTIDAVIRNFIVIGEAASHLPEEVLRQYPEIPWREMRDMRNIVVHEYFGVEVKILWEKIQSDLPPLIDPIEGIVENNK